VVQILKNDTVWRSLSIFLLTAIFGIGSWGLYEVAAIPKIYRTKVEAHEQKEEISKQICDLKKEITDTTKEIRKDIKDNQDKIEKKLDELNKTMLKYIIENNKK